MNIETAEYSLTQYFSNKNLTWMVLQNRDDIFDVYNIFFNMDAFNLLNHTNNCEMLYYYALYHNINNDAPNPEKYYIQSITSYNDTLINSPIYLQSLYQLASIYKKNNNYESMEKYMDLYLAHVIKSNVYNDYDNDIFINMGKYYLDKKNYAQACQYYCAAYDFGKFDQADKIYDIFEKYSNLLYSKNKYQESEQYFLKMIDFYDETKHKKNILATCYFNLAHVYNSTDIVQTTKYANYFVDFITSNELYDTYGPDMIISVASLCENYGFDIYERYNIKASYHGKMNVNQKMCEIYKKIITKLLENKEYDTALTCITRIKNNNPDKESLKNAHYGLAHIYLAKGDMENFTKYCMEYINFVVINNICDVKLLTELCLCGNINKTIELVNYLKSISGSQNLVDNVYNNCGDHYLEKKEYNVAEQLYKLSGQLNSKLTKIYAKQGTEHFNNGNNDLALECFGKAIELKGFDCASSMGMIYEKKNDMVSAEKYYVIAVTNGDYNCLINLSKIYETNKDYDSAIKYCKMAINNGYTPIIKYLSDLYIECGKIEESFELYSKYPNNF